MKRTMLRLFSLLLVVVLALGMAACGGKSDVTGTWVLSGGSQDGVTVDQETLEAVMGEMTYTFEDGGKVTMSLAGVSVEGTWTQDGDTVTLESQGTTSTMTLDGDKLTLEESGVTVEFTKK